jgi:UDP-glucose 4-epimerase
MRPAIIITGISGNLGRQVAKVLHKEDRIVGIDRRPFRGKPKDVEIHHIDIRRKKCEDIFRTEDVKAVVHMAIIHDPRMSTHEHHTFNVVGTQMILEYCARYKVPKVVVLSSANVYGPSPNNSNFLSEDAPLLAGERFPEVRDLIAADMFAQQFVWREREVETSILRPVHIIGPTVKNAPSNYLRMRYPWTLLGFDPIVQFIHEEDVGRAVQAALKPGIRGVYNVTGPGEVPLSVALRDLGRKPVPVPHILAGPILERLFKWHVSNYPPAELDHIHYMCTVDGSRFAKESGFRPAFTLRETIRSVMGDQPMQLPPADRPRVVAI